MKKVWMQEMTWEEIGTYLEKDDIVIVPIGSTEVHGRHLPLGTDSFEAIDYAEGIAKDAGGLLTPPIWFGDSPHHMGKPGTISLRSETIVELLTDIYRSLIHHGFKVIITFNGHRLANLSVIDIAARRVKGESPDVLFAAMDPVVIGATVSRQIQESPGEGIHGGELETSHMLYKHPDLVHMEKATLVRGEVLSSRFVTGDPFASGDKVTVIKGAADMLRMTETGHLGDPTVATREKGERLYEAIVRNGVAFIEEIRQAKNSEKR